MHDGCYIGFDYGMVNTGVAVGQSITSTASALKTVHLQKTSGWLELDEIIAKWNPAALIVGMPVTEDGDEQLITKQTRNFIKKLHKRYQLPIFEADERYSSMQASESFAQARKSNNAKKKHGNNLDSHAAKIILQRWLSNNL